MTINFDMDGTIADFYGVEGWLADLEDFNPRPYAVAKPLLNMAVFARQIHRLQRAGHEVCIISWLSKTGTEDFNRLVTETKIQWLKKHLPSVTFDEITIVEYGTPKYLYGKGILFDDEEKNRTVWNKFIGNTAYDVNDILNVLRGL